MRPDFVAEALEICRAVTLHVGVVDEVCWLHEDIRVLSSPLNIHLAWERTHADELATLIVDGFALIAPTMHIHAWSEDRVLSFHRTLMYRASRSDTRHRKWA